MIKDTRIELGLTYREAAGDVGVEIGSIQNYEKATVTHRRFLKYCLYLAKKKKMRPQATVKFLESLVEELEGSSRD